MNVLAVDTSTSVCSVALALAGQTYMRQEVISGRHSSVLFEQIQEVLRDSGSNLSRIDVVLYAAGPGSYTGLRVGGSALKGLLYPYPHIAFYAASTLAAFACCVQENQNTATVHAVMDARRQHAYYQRFIVGDNRISAQSEAEILPLRTIATFLSEGDRIIGTGLSRFEVEALKGVHQHPESNIHAGGLLKLREYNAAGMLLRREDITTFEPDYLSGDTWNHAR